MRRNETDHSCQAIHGGTDADTNPTLIGMVDTITCKFKSEEASKVILCSKRSLQRSLQKDLVKNWTRSYKISKQNKLRSLNVYYCHEVMGKRKYTNVRKANKNVKHAGHQVSNYVSYNDLAELIRTLDIGIVHNVKTLISSPGQNYDGAYREPIPYIQRLASFYLKQNEDRVDKLKEFSDFQKKCPDSFVFFLAVGGDGAPGAGTSILVSFLNCGQRLASSCENFLIFGANVNESSEIVTAFLTKFHKDLQLILGQFVSCAKAEPLHLKNNTVKEHFMKLFKICTAETNFRNFKNFKDLPSAALFVKFVIFIHNEMNCNFFIKENYYLVQ